MYSYKVGTSLTELELGVDQFTVECCQSLQSIVEIVLFNLN